MIERTVRRHRATRAVAAPEERSMRVLEWSLSGLALVFAIALTVFRA